MKKILLVAFFSFLLLATFSFLVANDSPQVSVSFWNLWESPSVSLGVALALAFYLGLLAGLFLNALTYVIKKLF